MRTNRVAFDGVPATGHNEPVRKVAAMELVAGLFSHRKRYEEVVRSDELEELSSMHLLYEARTGWLPRGLAGDVHFLFEIMKYCFIALNNILTLSSDDRCEPGCLIVITYYIVQNG